MDKAGVGGAERSVDRAVVGHDVAEAFALAERAGLQRRSGDLAEADIDVEHVAVGEEGGVDFRGRDHRRLDRPPVRRGGHRGVPGQVDLEAMGVSDQSRRRRDPAEGVAGPARPAEAVGHLHEVVGVGEQVLLPQAELGAGVRQPHSEAGGRIVEEQVEHGFILSRRGRSTYYAHYAERLIYEQGEPTTSRPRPEMAARTSCGALQQAHLAVGDMGKRLRSHRGAMLVHPRHRLREPRGGPAGPGTPSGRRGAADPAVLGAV